MFKKIPYIVFLFSSICYSQLSNKHWLPPLHCRDASSVADHYLYLSTQETTPFQITVTDGAGNPIGANPYTISATAPLTIDLGFGQNTKMFVGQTNVNIVLNDRGVILEGTKDFYVSFRVRSQNHAEILVSKGKPGIGTSFRLGHIINESFDNRKSFVTSVMATEDNTNISLSDYDPNIVFITSTGTLSVPSQSFSLNAGQSVIFTGYSNVSSNLDGAIGALITSDKPIAVNSGNAWLLEKIASNYLQGVTLTAPGFYGPQGRSLRGQTKLTESFFDQIAAVDINGTRITNFEMETSALYGIGSALGHNTLTICAIIANRFNKTYSKDYKATVNSLIEGVLNRLTTL